MIKRHLARWLCAGLVWQFALMATVARGGGLLREVYQNIGGNSVADLLASPNFPDSPDQTNIVATFEAPENVDENYGQRIRGYLVPPVTGNYLFWIASDDNSALFLSTDENPANRTEIASVPQWTSPRQWDAFPEQQSLPVRLEQGRVYYVEALHKEGGGSDNLSVRWQLPDGTIEEPIPEERLLPVGTVFSLPVILAQPSDTNVLEGQSATFSVQLGNTTPARFQWQKNGIDVAGATDSTLTIPIVAAADDGSRFRVIVRNALGGVTSREAVLRVDRDHLPPAVVSAQNIGRNQLDVLFSEPMDPASAASISNYAVSGGVVVSAARLGTDARTVTLTTSDLVYDATYTLTLNNLKDRSLAGNLIAANTRVVFTAREFALGNIGRPGLPGSQTNVVGGVDVATGGTGVGTGSDQLYFGYQPRSGNFDVRLRVQGLQAEDVWASAGLMARETLDARSRFAGVMATPTLTGSYFAYRAATNAVLSGTFPVNFPQTWLRLRRAGNVFSGFGSLDGETWWEIGRATNALGKSLLLGLAGSSQATNQIARIQFRDFGDTIDPREPSTPLEIEPLGPSSRRIGLVISEIMYHPLTRTDGRKLEFVELANTQPFSERLDRMRLSGEVDFAFPPNTVIPGGGYLVVAKSPEDIRAVYGITNVVGGFTNNLSAGGGTLRLRDVRDAVLLEVRYSNDAPWPAAAAGGGHSLVLGRASYGEVDARAWRASQLRGGSPGRADAVTPDPAKGVVINEFLAHTDDPQVDYVELYNHSRRSIDLSGAVLTDNAATNRFLIPEGTTLVPGGFVSFDQNTLGFSLSSTGESVFLINAARTRVLDAVRFGPQENGVASGRFPDASEGFQRLESPTPGLANARVKAAGVVINEIMYHPVSGNADDQYIELYNAGSAGVDLSGWAVDGGVSLDFPAGATIPAGGYLVVARNANRLIQNYPNLNSGNVVGNFSGSLAGSGERIALLKPLDAAKPAEGRCLVNEVTYADGGRWGKWSDGGGSSLELIDAHADNRLAANWADSDETRKASWSTVEYTGILDLGVPDFGVDNLNVLLLGSGECLVDDVQVIGANGLNAVSNGGFEDGLTGWSFGGTHGRTGLEADEGYNSKQSLNLRASERGDTGINQAKVHLSPPLNPGSFATVRARVRWLKGDPEILLRIRGNYLEVAGRMSVPANLGTPGAANSAAKSNLGPAISEVAHTPVAPLPGQSVVVTARVGDPDGVQAARLRYRVDPGSTLTTVEMMDDGQGADAVARDGVYTAVIPGQTNNTLVAFSIQAFDSASSRGVALFPKDAPAREGLIRFENSQPAGNLGAYRIWLTQANLFEWTNRHPASNDPLDATFAYGNWRAVYNMGTLFSGSPFHWTGYNGPLGNGANYVIQFPGDDQFLGSGDFVLNLPANIGSDTTFIREQTFFWMARELGKPYNHRRYHHLFINGVLRGPLFEDAQQPNGEFVKEWFPNDSDGQLFKIEDWFEYDDSAMGFRNTDSTLEDFVGTDGGKKQARYRWNWRKRADQGNGHDYHELYRLVDAVNAGSPEELTEKVSELVDIDEWLETMCLRHIVGDWDAFGYSRGKNMYAYKPRDGKWALFDWDIAFAFGLGDSATTDIFSNAGFDPVTRRMFQNPPFRRRYLQAAMDALNGPLAAAKVEPVMDARFAALKANRLKPGDPTPIKNWIKNRRTYLEKMLATNSAPFAITSGVGDGLVLSGNNLYTLTGTAPLEARFIRLNGADFPVTWTGVNNWTIRLALHEGLNSIRVEGFDASGRRLSEAAKDVSIQFQGDPGLGRDNLVINEIMYHPVTDGASFVEIYNRSATLTFDLTGWRLRGASFEFPSGSLIGPNGYLVVAANRQVFHDTYGGSIPVVGEFSGTLRNNGETLALVLPGATPSQDVVISQVPYDNQAPWPVAADGGGASLQLIDPTQDPRRVANWAVPSNAGGDASGWKQAVVTGTAASSTLFISLASAGDVYLDDVTLVAGATAGAGTNLVLNGTFESGLAGSWGVAEADIETATTNIVHHGGARSVHLVSTMGGDAFLPSLSQTNSAIVPGSVYTLSFWYLASTNGGGLTAGLFGSDVRVTLSLVPGEPIVPPYTPGRQNSVAVALPELPMVWINEIAPRNNTVADNSGNKHAWVELYNSGGTPVDLGSYFLSDSHTNLTRWAFPANTTIPARGFLLVWLDGAGASSTPTEPHTSFRVVGADGSLALTKSDGTATLVVDYVNYADVSLNASVGYFPDGVPGGRTLFATMTPRAANSLSAPPVRVRINEWMANNRSFLADPADGDFDDWFELYNPGPGAADLTGFSLTDNLGSTDSWPIPAGTKIPPGGFLLVWADGETGQNGLTNQLHANFKLNQDGEMIALLAPDRTVADQVQFGKQTADQSEGRYPDGAEGAYEKFTSPTPGTANRRADGGGIVAHAALSTQTGSVVLSWNTIVGKSYRVEFKSSLGLALWQPLGADLTAASSILTVTDATIFQQSQRYYRILQVN